MAAADSIYHLRRTAESKWRADELTAKLISIILEKRCHGIKCDAYLGPTGASNVYSFA